MDHELDYAALDTEDGERWTMPLPALGVTLEFFGGYPDWPHEQAELTVAGWPRLHAEARSLLRLRVRAAAVEEEFCVQALALAAEPPRAERWRCRLRCARRGDEGARWELAVEASRLERGGDAALYLHGSSVTREFSPEAAPKVPLIVSRARATAVQALDWIEAGRGLVAVVEPARLHPGELQGQARFNVALVDDPSSAISGHDLDLDLDLARLLLGNLPALFARVTAELDALFMPYEDGEADRWSFWRLSAGRRDADFELELKREGDTYGLFVVRGSVAQGRAQAILRSWSSTSH